MGKTKTDRKVNREVRKFNKVLEEDVFKDRFWVRQYQKAQVDGASYYLYELRDRADSSRNKVIYEWLRGDSQFFMSKIWEEMNNFIIFSNFWELYRKGEQNEDK